MMGEKRIRARSQQVQIAQTILAIVLFSLVIGLWVHLWLSSAL